MSVFQMYLELGITHIADFNAFDHILFLISLMASFQFYQWRKILKLITAFTLGHSISLALSVLNIVQFSIPIIELLIPVTIFLTALVNLINVERITAKSYIYEYLITLIFGIIHGMGFSVLLSSLLGVEESIIGPLAAFNIGIEIGQILIVFLILSLEFLFIKYLNIKQLFWKFALSFMALISSIYLILDRWPFY